MPIGYALSSEDFDGPTLVRCARRAEEAGFAFAMISVAKSVICGPDPQRHVDAIRRFLDAGFDHVYVHQIGPDQDRFIDFYAREILPAVEPVAAAG